MSLEPKVANGSKYISKSGFGLFSLRPAEKSFARVPRPHTFPESRGMAVSTGFRKPVADAQALKRKSVMPFGTVGHFWFQRGENSHVYAVQRTVMPRAENRFSRNSEAAAGGKPSTPMLVGTIGDQWFHPACGGHLLTTSMNDAHQKTNVRFFTGHFCHECH